MLRLGVLALLLANVLYFVWSHGFLAGLGLQPADPSESQRLLQQIQPERMRIEPAGRARPASGPGSASLSQAFTGQQDPMAPVSSEATACVQLGPFDDAQLASLAPRLEAALPAGSWTVASQPEPARWVVYMGRYTDPELLARKRAELRQRGIAFDAVNVPALSPGLSLGRFATEAAADQALAKISTRGVRTAKVVQERPETRSHRITFAQLSPDGQALLERVRAGVDTRPMQGCTEPLAVAKVDPRQP
ncbi:MAG: SPOR domain-containing protein [Pseudomonadota bacterium]